MHENEEIKKFLDESLEFRYEFKPKFIQYFVDLSASYDKFYSPETMKEVANVIYQDLFDTDTFIITLDKDISKEILEDGVMIGFLISRSMFFLLENYLKYINESENSKECMQNMLVFITDYINMFEKQLYKNKLQPLHLNFDTTDNLTATNGVFTTFKEIKDKGEEVTFFNLYKGIPIKHKATIIDIGDDEVSFRTIQTQEVAMKIDGMACILKDNNFDKYIKADIAYNNFANNTVVLRNFTNILNMPAISREFVRVHPDVMVKVTLNHDEELTTVGKLFDLSINGLGVISEENNGIYAGAKIHISFPLETINKNYHIDVEGEILNIIEYSSSYRYCIKIYPEAEEKEKIKDYVETREIDILNNLNKEVDFYN